MKKFVMTTKFGASHKFRKQWEKVLFLLLTFTVCWLAALWEEEAEQSRWGTAVNRSSRPANFQCGNAKLGWLKPVLLRSNSET